MADLAEQVTTPRAPVRRNDVLDFSAFSHSSLVRNLRMGCHMLTRVRPARTSRLLLALLAAAATSLLPHIALARDAGDPIRMTYVEGDLAGFSSIIAPDTQQPIGVVEYVQHRKGDILEAKRVAYFADGSSDEDSVEAKVGQDAAHDPRPLDHS